MRILLTTDTIGGVWMFGKELTTGLLGRGHEVALASFGRAPSPEQADWCAATANEYPAGFRYDFSVAPLEWMDDNEFAYSGAAPMLMRLADEFKADVLHSSQYCFGRLPLTIAKIITAHSDVLSWAAACRPDGLEPSPWLRRYVELVQWGLDGADSVVAPTEWMLNALREHFFVNAPTVVVPDGRSISAWPAAKKPEMQAVSVGRLWDEGKNLALLAGTDSGVPILVAGEQRHEGSAHPAELGKLIALGPLTEERLIELFGESSVYIVASRYEPFGLAPLEAALCGCAVLANDIPSLREVWGDAALYFNTSKQLTELLNALNNSPGELHAARAASRRRALEFTSSRMVERYIALYEEHMDMRGPSHHPRAEALAAHGQ